MIDRIKIVWYKIEIFYSKIIKYIGIRRSTEPIPKDTLYCYEYDEERNKTEPTNGYWIKPCKYYRRLNGENRGCTYLGYKGFDPLLWDQCKICGVNEDESE